MKHQLKSRTIGVYAGIAALTIGIVVFTLSWNLWDVWGGPMPGYRLFLYPGNLTLIYIWHPLFTEEVGFWPKLGLLMFGQFVVVAFVVGLLTALARRFR